MTHAGTRQQLKRPKRRMLICLEDHGHATQGRTRSSPRFAGLGMVRLARIQLDRVQLNALQHDLALPNPRLLYPVCP